MIIISRLLLVLTIFIFTPNLVRAKESSLKIGKVLERLLNQTHEFSTYQHIQKNEIKTCIDNEHRLIKNYTDPELFSKAWDINCTIITTSKTCSSVKKTDLHDCSKPKEDTGLRQIASNFKACYNGVKKSWKEWFKFMKQASDYIINKEERSKTNKKISKAYNSFKSYLAIEVSKHQKKYNSSKEVAFSAVTSSLLKKVVTGVRKVLAKAIPQVGCYNQQAKTRFTCQMLAEFFAEPLIMFKFVKIGLKALKGTKISRLVKTIRVPNLKKSIVSKKKQIKKEIYSKKSTLFQEKSFSNISQNMNKEYILLRDDYLNDPKNQSKSSYEKQEDLEEIKVNLITSASKDIEDANIQMQKALKAIGVDSKIIASGVNANVTALKFVPPKKMINVSTLKLKNKRPKYSTKNEEAIKLLKYKERFKTNSITFDIAQNFAYGTNGFSQSWNRRIDLGSIGIDEILRQRDVGRLAKHEFTHASFINKREKGIDSIYHSSYTSNKGHRFNTYKFYDRFMSSEELYTFSNQPYWRASTLLKEVTNNEKNLSNTNVKKELEKIIQNLTSLQVVNSQSYRLSQGTIGAIEEALKSGKLKKGTNVHFLTKSGKIAKSPKEVYTVKVQFEKFNVEDWVKLKKNYKNSKPLERVFNPPKNDKNDYLAVVLQNTIEKQKELMNVSSQLKDIIPQVKSKIQDLVQEVDLKASNNIEILGDIKDELRGLALKTREGSRHYLNNSIKNRKLASDPKIDSIFTSSYLDRGSQFSFDSVLSSKSNLLKYKNKLISPSSYNKNELLDNVLNITQNIKQTALALEQSKYQNKKSIDLLEQLLIDSESIDDAVKYGSIFGEQDRFSNGINTVIITNQGQDFKLRDKIPEKVLDGLSKKKLVKHLLEKQYAYNLYLKQTKKNIEKSLQDAKAVKKQILASDNTNNFKLYSESQKLSKSLDEVQNLDISNHRREIKMLKLENDYKTIEKGLVKKLSREKEIILSMDDFSKTEKEKLWNKKKDEVISSFDNDFKKLTNDLSRYLEKIGIDNRVIKRGSSSYVKIDFFKNERTPFKSLELIRRFRNISNTNNITIDPKTTLLSNRMGFSDPQNSRVEIGLQSLRDITINDSVSNLIKHEFKHAGFAKMKKLSIDSIYHSKYYSLNNSPLDNSLDTGYRQRFSAEELYNFTNGPLWLSEDFSRLETIDSKDMIERFKEIDLFLVQSDLIAKQTQDLTQKTIKHLERMKIKAQQKKLQLEFLDDELRTVKIDPSLVKEIKIKNTQDSFIFKDFIATENNRSLITKIFKKNRPKDQIELLNQLIEKQKKLALTAESQGILRSQAKEMSDTFIKKLKENAYAGDAGKDRGFKDLKELRKKFRELGNKVRPGHKSFEASPLTPPKRKSFLKRFFQ